MCNVKKIIVTIHGQYYHGRSKMKSKTNKKLQEKLKHQGLVSRFSDYISLSRIENSLSLGRSHERDVGAAKPTDYSDSLREIRLDLQPPDLNSFGYTLVGVLNQNYVFKCLETQ